MSSKNKGVGVREVADRANVSIGTVSRVLNNCSNVKASTIAAVRQAIAVLGYEPQKGAPKAASRKPRKKSDCILLCIGGKGFEWRKHPHINDCISGVEATCRNKGIDLVVEFNNPFGRRPSGKVQGMIFKGNANCHPWLSTISVPVVGISVREGGHLMNVAPDNRTAGIQVAQYLWDLGHRKIAFVSTTDPKNFEFLHRQQAIMEFLLLRDSFFQELVLWGKVPGIGASPETVYPEVGEQLDTLLNLPKGIRPTAIIAANDWIAAGIYNGLRQRNIEPGRDISIIGFEDQPQCEILYPRLSSYQLPILKTSQIAAELLISCMQTPNYWPTSTQILVPGELCIRDSVFAI